MLQLYYWPLACSLASRIALTEAALPVRYVLADIFSKTLVEGGGDFWTITPKGAVPVLVMEDGQTLTENAAVLQYIADRRPESGLAPAPGHADRYRLQEWLSFVGAEVHKGFLFPTFWYDDAAKAAARARIGKTLGVADAHLREREFLVGGRFTVADAYLAWALYLVQRVGVPLAEWPALAAYQERMEQRPAVAASLEAERQVRASLPKRPAPPPTA